ncbi:MAG: homocysteine S-methyltransferase family protein [Pseudomonadota bacterium]
MNRLKLLNSDKIFILDGAIGTSLQKFEIDNNQCIEGLNLINPQWVSDVHENFAKLNVNIITANTFSANRIKLEQYKLENKLAEINQTGVKLAKKACNKNQLVLASIGPTGKFIKPNGDLSFDNAYNIFKEQIAHILKEKPDIIGFETFYDILELKSAIVAARDLDANVAIFASMTFEASGLTMLGTSPEAMGVTLSAMDIEAIGINCSLGIDSIHPFIEKLISTAKKPVFVRPNAGLPIIKNGKTHFPMESSSFTKWLPKYIASGISGIGGCCGTTPDHIQAIIKACTNKIEIKKENTFYFSSRKNILELKDKTCYIAGERINPTGKEKLKKALTKKDFSLVKKLAKTQVEAGSHMLDVNIGIGSDNEEFLMEKALESIQDVFDIPLIIDSSNMDIIENALKCIPGKCLINSSTANEIKLKKMLLCAKKYGACLLVLPMDENGIPHNKEGRIKLVNKALKTANSMNFNQDNLFFDPLTLPISVDNENAKITLDTLEYLSKELKLKTVMGVSNVSFGLPNRDLINAAFLSKAMDRGLSIAIINPNKELMTSSIVLNDLIQGHKGSCDNYIKQYSQLTKEKENKIEKSSSDPIMSSILEFDDSNIEKQINIALEKNIAPTDIINNSIVPALQEVGDKYEKGEYFLPNLIKAADIASKAFKALKKALPSLDTSYGKMLIATVEGDIHDIGKNLVALFIENNGTKVIDLGKNVNIDKIIDAIEKHKPDIVGLSALMTTTVTEMKKDIDIMKSKNINAKIIVGGAVLTERYAKEIGADYYAKDAVEAAKLVNKILNNKVKK